MGRRGDLARQALLDSAEELFATHGIDSVSSRRIAEHAGQSNHSAVTYHFGGRDELLRELVDRYREPVRRIRADLIARLPADPGLTEYLQCLILPVTSHIGSLPTPTWRARLQRQLAITPSTAAMLTESARADELTDRVIAQIHEYLSAVPPTVRTGRERIVGRMIIDICAEYETRISEGTRTAEWTALGYFLTDACAGLLSAPVSHPDFAGL
ncbi:TetR/AcrR family transcriptional regulator [Nocardia carnea]|uniref:TetR/AcrR family transcriptional regulator n=1 Tax=Nocardia carnea TaxID=37328 RepID=A0ABW7TJ73_9NOCA|nr:helix-turn-helix domain-containing protein [Nocardia carnea]